MGVTLEYLNDNDGVMATVSGALTGAELIGTTREANAFALNPSLSAMSFSTQNV